MEFGEKGFSEAKWRTKHSVHRNGDLYPTHGVGPIAMMTNINRGNRFVSLTSTASKARGLHEYIVNHPNGGANHPNAKVGFNLGDIVTTVLKTSNGETMLLSHDTGLPRPYSLGFRVQGTNGIWMDVNKSLHIEGKSKPHAWEEAQAWLDKYDHPLWKRFGDDAKNCRSWRYGFFCLPSFCGIRQAHDPANKWMCTTPLPGWPLRRSRKRASPQAVRPQAFPDFTRGRWTDRKPDFAFGDAF